MQFEIEFYVTTRPREYPGNDRIENFTMIVSAHCYTEAQQKAFEILKQASTIEDLMLNSTKELITKHVKQNT